MRSEAGREPMKRVRVLIVDDSAVARRMVSDVLSADPVLEVVGMAPSGEIALAMVPQVSPDVLTLDVDMPGMSGLEALAAVRRDYPHLPVIMFSSLTAKGATITIDALLQGASDYVTKPESTGSVAEAVQVIRERLVPKIKGLCARAVPPRSTAVRAHPRTARASPKETKARRPSRVDVVAIGASTGGPRALVKLLGRIPPNFPVPIVIVQHMLPMFTPLLAERLTAECGHSVVHASSGDIVQGGKAWLAAGGLHMVVVSEGPFARIGLLDGPPENNCKPSVDVLFRSVAEMYGRGVLAVVMTGMGNDGVRGSEAVREAQGRVWIQDEASSVVWSMAGGVAAEGLAERTLPPEELGAEIAREAMRGTSS